MEWVRTNAANAMTRYEEVLSHRALKVAAAASGVASSPVSEEDHPPSREWYGGEGNVLRKYQREGVRWMAHNLLFANRGCVLADEMGLGKTAQSLALIDYVLRSQAAAPRPTIKPRGPALVVVPLSTLVNWEREAARWAPGAHVVPYVGNPTARAVIRQHELVYEDGTECNGDAVYKADVVLTTYEMVQADRSTLSKVPWSCLVVDEAHRLKNSGGRAVRDLHTLDFAGRVVLLTGTPLQNDTAELWSLLNFVDGRRFADKEDFESKFGAVKKAGQVEALHKPWRQCRRPGKTSNTSCRLAETLVECELMPLQKWLPRAVRAQLHQVTTIARWPTQQRDDGSAQVLPHPFLLDGVEEAFVAASPSKQRQPPTIAQLAGSSGVTAVAATAGVTALIFSQMTEYSTLEDYPRSRGHCRHRQLRSRHRRFCPRTARETAPTGRFVFALHARGGQASTCCGWVRLTATGTPERRAGARAARTASARPVQVYRLVMQAPTSATCSIEPP